MKAIFYAFFKKYLSPAMQVSVAEVLYKWNPHISLYRSTTVNEINKVEQYKNRKWR